MKQGQPGAVAAAAAEDEDDENDEPQCGFSYDHDLKTDYDGPDGRQFTCRNCGAEIWEEPDDEAETQAG